MRMFITVNGPNRYFHLIPNVRIATRNKHHVTWVANGLLKHFHRIRQPVLDRIRVVYSRSPQFIEQGEVLDRKSIRIVSIGSKLSDALSLRKISADEVLRNVRSGLDNLHALGFAHCDVCVDNVFVTD